MICVLASIKVKPGKKTEYLELFKANVPNVLAEAGCIEYAPMVDVDINEPIQEKNGELVTVVEKWESVAHLKAHFKAPHMVSFKEKVGALIEGVSLKVLSQA
jgi:quinol monooxygenase YgiN